MRAQRRDSACLAEYKEKRDIRARRRCERRKFDAFLLKGVGHLVGRKKQKKRTSVECEAIWTQGVQVWRCFGLKTLCKYIQILSELCLGALLTLGNSGFCSK